MSSMMEQITKILGSGGMKQLGANVGANEQQTSRAAALALPAILGALARNSQKADGAESLSNALAKDHDGSILDNLSGFLGNAQGAKSAGDGILRHALGERRAQVESNVSRASGLDQGATASLMASLAPLVMGALGKTQREGKLDAAGVAGLLGNENRVLESNSPVGGGLLGKLLDSDGDGDFDMQDIQKKGMGFLGKLLGGR